MIRAPRASALSPYTTLFRSRQQLKLARVQALNQRLYRAYLLAQQLRQIYRVPIDQVGAVQPLVERSEEHTSELQSHSELVCRLLLEKKKPSRVRDIDVQRHF